MFIKFKEDSTIVITQLPTPRPQRVINGVLCRTSRGTQCLLGMFHFIVSLQLGPVAQSV